MTRRRDTRYKRYLDTEADLPIPASTWYRFKKRRREETEACRLQAGDDPSPAGQDRLRNDDERTVGPGHETGEPEILQKSVDEACRSMERGNVGKDMRQPAKSVNNIGNVGDEACMVERERDVRVLRAVNENGSSDLIRDGYDSTCASDADENLLLRQYANLEEAIASGLFEKKTTTSSSTTFGELVLMALKYVLTHSLSLTQTTDLFRMLNNTLGEPLMPNSGYMIDKYFFPKEHVHYFATCSNCGMNVGEFVKTDRELTCGECGTVVHLKDYSYRDFFVILDIASPVCKIIECHADYYERVVNREGRSRGCIGDIYDGRKYIEFLESLPPADARSYVTLTFNTDGAPLFESSSYSIWPIFVMVNEIPYHARSRELVLAGLWFGKSKPTMNVFFEPFVDCIKELSEKGVRCTINGVVKEIKVFALVCCVDAVARAPIQSLTQFNGAYGCGVCLHPGEWVRNDEGNRRSGTMRYPLLDYVPPCRNAADTIQHMEQAVRSGTPVCGVRGASELINLPKYEIVDGNVVDYLHCSAGIAKQLTTSWFGTKKKNGLLPRRLEKNVDARMKKIKTPHQIGRLARPLSEREFWKAKEWENWTLYYSLTVLKDILPNAWLVHWALYVEALHTLLKDRTTVREVRSAELLMHKFVGQTELIYGKKAMSFNIHSATHLAKSVIDWGPLWAHSTYAFEAGNGELLKVIHAAKGVHNQICRRISLQYSYRILKAHIYPSVSFDVGEYCDTLGSNTAKRTYRPNEIRYFGTVSMGNDVGLNRFNLGQHSVAYKKIVKDSCLYVSALRPNDRSDNSFALLTDATYVKLLHFVVDDREEYTVILRVVTRRAYDNAYSALHRIVSISNEQSVIRTSEIARICVHMTVERDDYLCAVPNLYYY